MQVALYSDGRPVNYDEATRQFSIGAALLTPDQVAAYDRAGQLAWASPDLRTWFYREWGVAAPAVASPVPPVRKKSKVGLVIGLLLGGLVICCALFGVLAVISAPKSGPVQVESSGSGEKSTAGQEVQPKVGQTFRTDKFEITVLSVDTRKSVGTEFFQSNPAEGGVYVTVRWKVKNISDKPIGIFGKPTLKLVDGAGTTYDPDVGASSSYATELKQTEKVISDLNPGIAVTGGEAFEVAKGSFNKASWVVLVNADRQVKVSLK